MAKISDKPIKKYELGMPCMLGEVVGRIVAESDKGSWGYIDGKRMPSIVMVSTPHGSVIETGILYVSEITKEGRVKLVEYEREALERDEAPYAGYIEVCNIYEQMRKFAMDNNCVVVTARQKPNKNRIKTE